MKRILSVILVCAMVLSCCMINAGAENVSAQNKSDIDTMKSKILIDLGILPDDFSGETQVTRIMFLRAIGGIMNDEEMDDDAVFEIAKSMGVTSAENLSSFGGDAQIRYNEAIKMLVATAGYGRLAELKGGYPMGYVSVARNAKIIGSLNGSGDTFLDADDAVELLYSTIEASVMTESGFSSQDGESDYNINYAVTGDSVIYFYRGLLKVQGIVNGNHITSFEDADRAWENIIQIDGIDYKYSDAEINSLMGYPVVAYCDENNVIKGIAADEEDVKVVSVYEKDIIGVDGKITTFTYYDEKGKEIELKLSDILDVVYNGKTLPDYDAKDLIPESGSVKLIDNNDDKIFDVAVVSNTELFFVNYVSSKTKMIYNQYDKSLIEVLDLGTANITYNFTLNGEPIRLMDIRKNDILEIYASKSGSEARVTGTVTRDLLKGKIKGISEDEVKFEVSVDATEGENSTSERTLELNPQYVREVDGTNAVRIGANATVFLDSRGRAAAFEVKNTDEFYAFVTGIGKEGEFDPVMIKYLSEDGNWYVEELADKVKYNLSTVKSEVAYQSLGGSNFARKLMRLKKNTDNKISSLLLPGIDTEGDTRFVESKNMSGYWYPQNYSISWQIYLDTAATLFLVPENEDAEDDDYAVIAPGKLSGEYTFKIYNADEFACSSLAIVNNPMVETISDSAEWFMVTDIEKTLNADGDEVIRLYSVFGNDETNTCVSKKLDVFADVNVGDIISFTMDNNGRVRAKKKIHDINDGPVSSPPSNYHLSAAISKGTLIAVDVENGKLRINQGNEITASVPTGTILQIYDVENEEMIKGTIADLKKGDYIIMYYVWSQYGNMMAIRY